MEFLGRADHQVKVRGHRLELGEVEAALEGCPGVARAVVVAVGERRGRRLAGFVVPAVVDVGEVRRVLADRLPGYAVPSVISAV
ncbi:AMP-binding enzyme, partial [Planomonospora algeriensis]